jgi:NAD(P)H-hydrate epimerase
MQQQGITSLDLMERAATACCDWIKKQYYNSQSFLVACGMGNNGGDGLALARMLLQEGYSVKVIILKHREKFTENASHNLKLLHHLAPDHISILEEGFFVTELPEDIIIIDALFGMGLNRPLSGWPADFIRELNLLPNKKIAVDIPAGLPADNIPNDNTAILEAAITLSFQLYKRSFLHPESAPYTGKVFLLDIGLSPEFIADVHTLFHILDEPGIKALYRPRGRFSHKGDYGTVSLFGGSYGKMGAIALSAKGALHSGAGKIFIHAPECGYGILQAVIPEAMFQKSGGLYTEQIAPGAQDTVGIGPGMSTETLSSKALSAFLEKYDKPLVLDADALNIIAANKALLSQLPGDSILTPHPGECERLFGPSRNSMEQTELARSNAMEYNIYIVLKGHHTAICSPDGACWYNITGNAGMATGGSGDVLTGIITSLLAQHYSPHEAAMLGAWLHGMAGDLAAEERSEEALSAGNITDYIGKAFLKIKE